MAKDNTVRYQGRRLQIPPDRHRFHYVKVPVRVHQYPDETLTVFHGPRCVARYHADGRLIAPDPVAETRPRHRATARSLILGER